MELSNSDLLELGKKTHAIFPKERSRCSVYGVGWADGKVKDLDYYHCHAGLMNFRTRSATPSDSIPLDKEGNGPCVISNQVQSNREWLGWKEAEKYYQFLFNDSVFADCYVTKDPATVKEWGITVRTDRPPNLVAAACIATRQAWEYKEIGRTVVYLIENGIEPWKAHLAAHCISITKSGEFYSTTRTGHVAIYSSFMGKAAVKNFLAGKVDKSIAFNLRTYQEKRSYNGIPEMWGPDGISLKIRGGGDGRSTDSDPFGFVKELAIRNTVVDAVNEAYERLLGND